jgi:hypothetical protein
MSARIAKAPIASAPIAVAPTAKVPRAMAPSVARLNATCAPKGDCSPCFALSIFFIAFSPSPVLLRHLGKHDAI